MNMNRIQQVDRDQDSGEAKHLFDAKGKTLAQPSVRHSFKPTSWPNPLVANVMLAFSFFGFLWPYHPHSRNERHHTNFLMQASADDWGHATGGFISPTRSAGWNDLNNS
jgi:hypothetical protein